jgi:hypothetical protein
VSQHYPQPAPRQRSPFTTAVQATLGVVFCLVALLIAGCTALLAIPTCAIMKAAEEHASQKASSYRPQTTPFRTPEQPSIPDSPNPPPRTVTAEEFAAIQKGMTLDQVETIVGAPGERKGTPTTPYYLWRNDDGTSCQIGFEDGRVTTCLEFGLTTTKTP